MATTIDTIELARELQTSGGIEQKAAAAIAQAIKRSEDAALRAEVSARIEAKLDKLLSEVSDLRADIKRVEETTATKFLFAWWGFGVVIALVIAVLATVIGAR
jgi:cell division protein FtsX